MLETLICVVMGCNLLLSLALMFLLAWRESEHRKQIEELTSKLASKTLADYTAYKVQVDKEPVAKPEKPQRAMDSVLGSHC